MVSNMKNGPHKHPQVTPQFNLDTEFHKTIVRNLNLEDLQFLGRREDADLYYEHSGKLCIAIFKGSALSIPSRMAATSASIVMQAVAELIKTDYPNINL